MSVCAVFVYGTLKRGELREPMWPLPPQSVEPATTLGQLFDLGEYPAILEGDQTILGELWTYEPDAMAAVLTVLDEIEEYHGRTDDLYIRRVIDCCTLAGRRVQAFAYFYSDPTIAERFEPMPPGPDGTACWTGNC